ncbi:hypothetical protein FRB90_002877 [Tulasnella sp. 427]|nr:hypothetical protein FRB90_002877 [Tulasnella sp. 427]
MDILRRLQNHDAGIDLSDTLRDETSWNPGLLWNFKLSPGPSTPTSITAITTDATLGLLAIGTFTGHIHLFGAAPVSITLSLPVPNGANMLHIWDLVDLQAEEPTPPTLLKDSSFPIPDNVTFISTSPLHSHAFIALQSGEIMTFDVDRICPSPYVIYNTWLDHQDVLNRTSEAIEHRIPTVMEILAHPRDLNLLFIAYDGGVVLWNTLAVEAIEKRCARDALERYPPATSLAIHPSGHMLAIGHLDGCISFWAVEDDDRPLAVRTLSEPFSFIDVNVPDPMALIDNPEDEAINPDHPPRRQQQREPVFKLAWSGFGEVRAPKDSQYGAFSSTTLTILGGTTASDQQGVTVLNFPGLVLPTPDVTAGPMSPSSSTALPPSTRQALKRSLFPPESLDASTQPRSVYPSKLQIEDFCLVPKENPYLNGFYDPASIIILSSDADAPKSVLTAFEFPPEPRDTSNMPTVDIYRNAFRRSRLPPKLSFTYSPFTRGVTSCQIVVFHDRQVFGQLLSGFVNGQDKEPMAETNSGWWIEGLRGGSGWSDFSAENAPDPKLSKFDHHRLMILSHSDLTVRFYDISSQLLSSTESLKFEYPQILPHLTLELARFIPLLPSLDTIKINSVHLASFSAECAVVLSTGDVITWRLREAGSSGQVYKIPAEDSQVFVPLEPFIRQSERRISSFHPFCHIRPPETAVDESLEVTASGLSDVGLMAAAYNGSSLAVFDLRYPRVILRASWLYKSGDKDKLGPVTTLAWAVCAIASDKQPRLRLIVSHQHGTTRVITLNASPETGQWEVVHAEGGSKGSEKGHYYEAERSSPTDVFVSTVLDGRTGDECLATPTTVRKVEMTDSADVPTKSDRVDSMSSFWVVGGKKEARCFESVTGKQVGHVEWTAKIKNVSAGAVHTAKVLSRSGYQVLAAFHEDQKVSLYSLPDLEFIRVLGIPPLYDSTVSATVSCDSEGDYLALLETHSRKAHQSLHYGTLFDFRRPKVPLVDLGEPRLKAPEEYPVPSPVALVPPASSSGLSSWIWGPPKTLRGSDLDSLLAGPDRPPPRVARSDSRPKSSTARVPHHKGIAPTKQPEARTDLYSRLRSAAAERGEALNDLGEQFSSLESASKDMAGQAKKLAAKQAARSWFPRFG